MARFKSLLSPLLSPLRRLAGRPPAGPWPRSVAICALVDDRVHNAVRRLQLELEARHGANPGLDAPPHVTLKLGFTVVAPEALEQYLDELAASSEPFDLSVGDLGFFDEGIVILDVERHPRLEALRQRLLGELAARFGVEPYPLESGHGFRFHITIAHGLAPKAFAEARRSLPTSRAPLQFRLERLALLYAVGDAWFTGRIATLGRPR